MKINTLKIFTKLIDTGSYSLAAEKMDLTQPAISMQIKALEERFETELVYKEKGNINLTPAGKAVYNNAKDIIQKWEKLLIDVENKKDKLYKSIIIGSSTIPSEYILPDLLADFSKNDPEIKSCIEVGDSAEMIELLDKGEVDIIIVGSKPTNSKYETIEIVEDELRLITPLDHNLTKKNKIKIQDLKSESILIREVGSGTRKAMLEGFKNSGVQYNELNIKCRLGSTEAIIAAVQAGLGISFVSKFASSKASEYGRVKEIKVSEMDLYRKFYIAYNKNRKKDELIKRIISSAKKIFV
ncbi:MAG: selenium metabolism-associated LysR family transcriptional regulator [Halanaerobiales bacterium]|nr:selenium metabolism-associated LysR family transcriptional regulator [Halanaerobiales bacterium]